MILSALLLLRKLGGVSGEVENRICCVVEQRDLRDQEEAHEGKHGFSGRAVSYQVGVCFCAGEKCFLVTNIGRGGGLA